MSSQLKDVLMRFTVPELKGLANLADVSTGGLKEQVIERICSVMLGQGLRAIWAGLDATQQAAVAEASHHFFGEYSEQCFVAKYTKTPAFYTGEPPRHYYSAKSGKTALALFFYRDVSTTCPYGLPTDLQACLREFVPRPAAAVLASQPELADETDLTVRLTEREALQDVVVLLRTLTQTRVAVSDKTAEPAGAAQRLLTGILAGGDFYRWMEKPANGEQGIGAIKAFAWPLLLQAGGLAASVAGRLTLTPTGLKGLSKPPAELLRGLWQKWLNTTLLDEFSRIDEIKGQASKGQVMSAAAPRRAMVDAALRACPVGQWVAFDEFSRYMQASSMLFVVAYEPWQLYLCERRYGSLEVGLYDGWPLLQLRYLLVLLFEYAATLGILDVAYVEPHGARQDFPDMWGADDMEFLSPYDGLRAIRLTPLGAYVLGLTDAYQPAVTPSTAALSVMPDLRIKVARGELSTEETLLLENWAIRQDPTTWQLDRALAMSSLEKGHDITELRTFLETADSSPLPEKADHFIRQCAANASALKITGNAVLVQCRDATVCDAIAAHKETAALCLRAGPQTLVVRTAQVEKFRERVRLLGFGVAV
jgi:hypothetical protein